MSHVSKVECQISDLDALEVAVERLGGELVRGQQQFQYYAASKAPCVHAIRLKDRNERSYEVGLRFTDATMRTFDLHCDFFDGSLRRTFGENLVGLQNEYQAAVAERVFRQQRYRVQRVEEAGRIRLVAVQ